MTTALAPVEPRHVLFSVLTLKNVPSTNEGRYKAFRELAKKWRSLVRLIRRELGPVRYVATTEVHRSGVPHLNVVIECATLADMAGEVPADKLERKNARATNDAAKYLKPRAVRRGFGYILTVERALSVEDVSYYVTKLAGDMESRAPERIDGRLVGEVTKMSQVPEQAPRHFRRLWYTTRFLPPRKKVTEWTGCLVTTPAEDLKASGERLTSSAASASVIAWPPITRSY
jgi:hypothetical protein